SPFFIRKKFFSGILSRSLQRCLILVRPNSLQVGFAPRSLERSGPRRLVRDGEFEEQDHGQQHGTHPGQLESSSLHLTTSWLMVDGFCYTPPRPKCQRTPSPCYLVAGVRPAFAASKPIQPGRGSIGYWRLASS